MSIFTDMGAAIEEAEYLADAEQCSQAIVREDDHMIVLPYAEARGREMPIIRQVELLPSGQVRLRSTEPGTPARLLEAGLSNKAVSNYRRRNPASRLTDAEIVAEMAARKTDRVRRMKREAVAAGMHRQTINHRLRQGYTLEQACSRKSLAGAGEVGV